MAYSMRWLLLAALLCIATTAHAQLNGVYTCANGNPGNAFNYGDIGAFFDALEAQGMGGPVTLNVFDDGGPFTSSASYRLGGGPLVATGIQGLSAARTLTIQAAPGERPVITGGGAGPAGPPGSALSFFYVGHMTIEGLEIINGGACGIFWQGNAAATSIRIRRCRIHDTPGNAIVMETTVAQNGSASDVTIENNWIWGCLSQPAVAAYSTAVVTGWAPGANWVVRHNTVLYHNAAPNTAAFGFVGGSIPVAHFVANVVHCGGMPAFPGGSCVSFVPLPVTANYNIYHTFDAAQFGGGAGVTNFQHWRTQGKDASGAVLDPLLVGTQPGQIDLRLRAASPCVNRVALATVNVDILGATRPVGGARDSGAHEYAPPVMFLEYNAAPLLNGGSVNVGGVGPAGSAFMFTVRNGGPGHIEFTFSPRVIFFPGTNCHHGSHVAVQPPARIPPGGADVFSMFIKPFALGPIDLLVSIENTDPLRNPFTFTINATGVPGNQAAVVTAPPGSAITGPPGGPFACDLVMGVPPANVSLLVTDPEGDPIILQFSGPIGPMIFGLTGPQLGPASPLPLVFTGMPAAAPGVYLWFINYFDAGSQSVLPCQINFTVVNLPPTHILAGATAGAGTLNAPYECAYDRGKGPADTIGLCLVDDPNAGQTVLLAWSAAIPGNPGAVGFNFSLAGPILTVAPWAMLTVAETGQHLYELQLTDGLAVTTLYVAVVVGGPALVFANASLLPDGYVDRAYTLALALNGVVAPATFTVTAGALPDGLTLDAGTGEITGTPTQTGLSAFTVDAADITGATTSRAFTLEITTPPPPKRQAAGGSGCVAGAGAGLVPLLLLAAVRRRVGKGRHDGPGR